MRTNLIKPEVKPEVKIAVPPDEGMLDMVIAFDTTGSMNSYIGAVKNHVTELVPKLFKANPNLRLGIVAFGDYCDMPSKNDFGKAYQVLNLTNDEAKIIDFVKKAESTSGGDVDEFYELVIKKIVEETNWREASTKAVLLIADANPHEIGYSYFDRVINNQISWRKEAKKAADKGIKFDTLTITKYTWYKELSEITHGISAPFKSSGKTSQLVEAAAMSRGSKMAKEMYKATMDSVMMGDDEEMKAVYTAYSKEVIS